MSRLTSNSPPNEFKRFKTWRQGQREALEELLTSNKKFKILEAPTGFGKTLVATSYHLIRNLKYTVYSPTTKLLQDQYIEDFGSIAVDLKGRLNYPCLLKGIKTAADCIDSEELSCPCKRICLYCSQVEEARFAEIAVLNIWALLNQINHADRFTLNSSRPDEPRRTLLILDEADCLEDTLIEYSSLTITKEWVRKHFLPKPDFLQENVPYWKSWISNSLTELNRLISLAPEEVKYSLLTARMHLAEIDKILSDSWVVESNWEDTVTISPTKLNNLSHLLLLRHFEDILMMSATFCGADIFASVLGVPATSYKYVYSSSPFPPRRRPVYYIPIARVTHWDEDETYPEIAKAVDLILDTFPLQTIIHTVSNKRAEVLLALSKHRDKMAIHNSETPNISPFKKGEVKYLVSPSLKRGYDFPEDTCRVNIITKIPYPYKGSKSVQARMRRHPDWYAWKTIQNLVQMTGRSTRSADDYSLTFILDEEFERLVNTSGYLFPKWWIEACRLLSLEDLNTSLLEEARAQ